jgi:SagB-type dehydrogenase family enzyme
VPRAPDAVHRYHDGTKHHFGRFARSLGYLDWASQPAPFRTYAGAPQIPLHPGPRASADRYARRPARYDELYKRPTAPAACDAPAIGDLLRHSFGLSAWKETGYARWSLRVNPSSGNLHPTEAYVICGAALDGPPESAGVYHYLPERHALERRCAFDPAAWKQACGGADLVLVALTSIHWRESWKYGERAFRYCQHDLGHGIGAVVLAASALGWRAALLPAWSQGDIATVAGTDRDQDFVDAEREDAAMIIALTAGDIPPEIWNGPGPLLGAVQEGQWSGRASQLSVDHVQWTFIDDITRKTVDKGRALPLPQPQRVSPVKSDSAPDSTADSVDPGWPHGGGSTDARALMLQRRSAVALDGHSRLDRSVFLAILARVMPAAHPPWSALWWTPRIHLLLLVHRVDLVRPGLYVLGRETEAVARLRRQVTRDFRWEPVHDQLPLFCLEVGDCTSVARRVSCDQDIAADGFFSLGMIADFDASLSELGASFYRHLFWECGLIGQVLYLEAEAHGVRGTGIGCFYDDPVHGLLGLQGHAFQSLYHFSVGVPVEDTRLSTRPGYEWE